jgi:hypothetical protein
MPSGDQSEPLAESKKIPHSKSVFVWNVLTFLVIGSLVCLWAQYYTDRLPEIAPSLAEAEHSFGSLLGLEC